MLTNSVTVICTAFNHVDYIAQCLDSLIAQEVDFPMKIVVHDDASCDGTADVIRGYVALYPGLIVPIIQEQNIYSKGESWHKYVMPFVEGEYIAICEGDDWWVDSNKLKMQYDYMEEHPECAMCCHQVIRYDDLSSRYLNVFPRLDTERDLTIGELIEGGGGFLGTNSFFFRSSYLERPDEFNGWGVGDYPAMVYYATQGAVHFFPVVMSAYRANAKGSWSLRTASSREANIAVNESIINGLERANSFTGGEFAPYFKNAIMSHACEVHIAKRDWKGLHEGEVGDWFCKRARSTRLKAWMRCVLPDGAIARLVRAQQWAKGFTSTGN